MDKSILVPLGDPRLKDISEAISNKSCNKILDFLASRKDGASVSDIAKELGMPINTADYNVKKLLKAGLIVREGHWWSVKGKKMPTYKVSNRKIVISPAKRDFTNLKVAVLLILLSGVVAMFLRGYSEGYQTNMFLEKTLDSAGPVLKSSPVAGKGVERGESYSTESWKYFLWGAWSMIALFFAVSYVLEKRKSSVGKV